MFVFFTYCLFFEKKKKINNKFQRELNAGWIENLIKEFENEKKEENPDKPMKITQKTDKKQQNFPSGK